MKIQYAIMAMREGKLVFRRKWVVGGKFSGTLVEYGIKTKPDTDPMVCFRSYNSASNNHLTSDDILADDWTYEGNSKEA